MRSRLSVETITASGQSIGIASAPVVAAPGTPRPAVADLVRMVEASGRAVTSVLDNTGV